MSTLPKIKSKKTYIKQQLDPMRAELIEVEEERDVRVGDSFEVSLSHADLINAIDGNHICVTAVNHRLYKHDLNTIKARLVIEDLGNEVALAREIKE